MSISGQQAFQCGTEISVIPNSEQFRYQLVNQQKSFDILHSIGRMGIVRLQFLRTGSKNVARNWFQIPVCFYRRGDDRVIERTCSELQAFYPKVGLPKRYQKGSPIEAMIIILGEFLAPSGYQKWQIPRVAQVFRFAMKDEAQRGYRIDYRTFSLTPFTKYL